MIFLINLYNDREGNFTCRKSVKHFFIVVILHIHPLLLDHLHLFQPNHLDHLNIIFVLVDDLRLDKDRSRYVGTIESMKR